MPKQERNGRIGGFGPVCTPELQLVGIESAGQIRQLGWEECFHRWVARFPNRINVNAAYGMIAAEQGIGWRCLTAEDKARAKRVVERLRRAGRGADDRL
ncbi:MAG: hypothetical protein JNK48_09225 [Bryobacterales bacterium]|nr:hypothetical protein [Bryobacterales bacterium]